MAREAGFSDWWINPPEPERKGMCYGMLARLVEIAQAIKREKVDVLETEYVGASAGVENPLKPVASIVQSMIAPLLVAWGGQDIGVMVV